MLFNMKAQPVLQTTMKFGDEAVAHLSIWAVPQPVRGSAHGYKYRLAYVVNGECVLRFDNEAGKGDHKHVSSIETAYVFAGTDALVDDFLAEIRRWNDENDLV